MFSTVSCDCVAKRTDCFDNLISSPLGSCTSDVTVSGSCQGVQISKGTFNGTTPVTTTAKLISSASFVGSSDSSASPQKRASVAKKVKANYNVVKNNAGRTVGQIIGNAVSYNFSQAAANNVTVCLSMDSSISLNKTAYPNYDIAQV